MHNVVFYYKIAPGESGARSLWRPPKCAVRHIRMSLKKIDKLLNSKGEHPLENLVQRAQKMDHLVAALRAKLTSAQAEQVVAANLRDDGELVIVCRNSAWAARLRFEGDALLEAARTEGYDALRCRVRVERQ